jgi:hypothetical protein
MMGMGTPSNHNKIPLPIDLPPMLPLFDSSDA